MPILELEFEMHVDLGESYEVGAGPFGARVVATTTGGRVSGDRLKGALVGSGGDWPLIGQDGVARLDIRSTITTVDDAVVFVQSLGLLEVTPQVMGVLGGGGEPAAFGDGLFWIHMRAETGDERYAWLNRAMLLAEGRFVPGPAIEYRVYRLEH